MKKILIPTIVLALVLTITANATVTTPPNATSTTATSTATSTHSRTPRTEARTEGGTNGTDRTEKITPPRTQANKDSLSKKELTKADASCAKNALAKRDSVVTAGLQKYTSGWIDAINTRRAAQNIAFDKTGTERLQLLRASRVIAKKTQDTIQKELRLTKNAAGQIFRGEMRVCAIDVDSTEE